MVGSIILFLLCWFLAGCISFWRYYHYLLHRCDTYANSVQDHYVKQLMYDPIKLFKRPVNFIKIILGGVLSLIYYELTMRYEYPQYRCWFYSTDASKLTSFESFKQTFYDIVTIQFIKRKIKNQIPINFQDYSNTKKRSENSNKK